MSEAFIQGLSMGLAGLGFVMPFGVFALVVAFVIMKFVK